jgi:predicted acetyltransferase
MLRLAPPAAGSLGLTKVFVARDDANATSTRTIEKDGGGLQETKTPQPHGPLKRCCWLTLT